MNNAIQFFSGRHVPAWQSRNSFDDFFDRSLASPWAFLQTEDNQAVNRPRVEVEEGESAFLFSADLPGCKKEDIGIQMEDDVLVISAERKRGGADVKFERRFSLPQTADREHIEAQLADGVLTVAVFKREQVKPKTVAIQDGKPGFFERLLGTEKKETAEIKS